MDGLKVMFSLRWHMTWCDKDTRCCGPPRRSLCNAYWQLNAICACRRNW